MGLVGIGIATAAATLSPATEIASVPVTAAALIATVPIDRDPLLAAARLRPPTVAIEAPVVPLAQSYRAVTLARAELARAEDFTPRFDRAPAEPLWSPVFSSMEIGRSYGHTPSGPLSRVFGFRVTDRNSEPSLSGIAGTLWRISENSR